MRSGELVPAVVAIGGGSALYGAIALRERRLEADMRSSRLTYALTFPVGSTSSAALSALASMCGMQSTAEMVFEVAADASGIHHLLHAPEKVAISVVDHLAAGLPGTRFDAVVPRSSGDVTVCVRIVVPASALLRHDADEQSSRALLTGLAALRDDERVSLRWAVRPGIPPTPVDRSSNASPRSRAQQRAEEARMTLPGFLVAGLLLVRAGSRSRARELTDHVVGVLRSRRGVGRGLVVRAGRYRATASMPVTGRSRGWLSAKELLPLLTWPLGNEPIAGVEVGAARRIAVPRDVGRAGRVLMTGRDAYGERPVALADEGARHHLALVGPSGTGKSTAMCRYILDDLARGRGGVVIDPKGDLAADVLDRVSSRDADRVVVLNPAAGDPVPGLDLFAVGDPDLRADVVLGALESIFSSSWGVRTDTYLRLGLRTLGELPDPVLTDWMRMFTDATFRRAAVARLHDPMLVAAWQSYEALSDAERGQHVAAPMGKVMSLLSRPSVRAVLAQRNPRLDIAQLMSERKWLVVSLSPGTLGEPATRLLGSIITYAVWSAVEARSALPPEERRPVFLYLDELQALAGLPFGIEYLFERARGLGCGVTVATQGLGRLPDSIRQSLLGNVGSLVVFRLGYDEATRIARELPGLGPQDLQGLRRFEVAGRVSTGTGAGVAVLTGTTLPLPAPTGQARRIRELSAERYGRDPAAIDGELRQHNHGSQTLEDAQIGRARRAS